MSFLPPNPHQIAAIMAKVHNQQVGAPQAPPPESGVVGRSGGPLPVNAAAAKRAVTPKARLAHLIATAQGGKSPIPAVRGAAPTPMNPARC